MEGGFPLRACRGRRTGRTAHSRGAMGASCSRRPAGLDGWPRCLFGPARESDLEDKAGGADAGSQTCLSLGHLT